jgi:hypothetical protein
MKSNKLYIILVIIMFLALIFFGYQHKALSDKEATPLTETVEIVGQEPASLLVTVNIAGKEIEVKSLLDDASMTLIKDTNEMKYIINKIIQNKDMELLSSLISSKYGLVSGPMLEEYYRKYGTYACKFTKEDVLQVVYQGQLTETQKTLKNIFKGVFEESQPYYLYKIRIDDLYIDTELFKAPPFDNQPKLYTTKKGQTIGKTGQTGNADDQPLNNAHLHYEIYLKNPKKVGWENRQTIDPQLLYNIDSPRAP